MPVNLRSQLESSFICNEPVAPVCLGWPGASRVVSSWTLVGAFLAVDNLKRAPEMEIPLRERYLDARFPEGLINSFVQVMLQRQHFR